MLPNRDYCPQMAYSGVVPLKYSKPFLLGLRVTAWIPRVGPPDFNAARTFVKTQYKCSIKLANAFLVLLAPEPEIAPVTPRISAWVFWKQRILDRKRNPNPNYLHLWTECNVFLKWLRVCTTKLDYLMMPFAQGHPGLQHRLIWTVAAALEQGLPSKSFQTPRKQGSKQVTSKQNFRISGHFRRNNPMMATLLCFYCIA